MSVRNLHVRGARLDVYLKGIGADATYVLNGKSLPEGFIPWAALAKDRRNTLEITVK